MKPRDFPSIAEYYRAHREVFELALELGVTPAAAEPIWRSRQHEEKLAEIRARRALERLPAPSAPHRAPPVSLIPPPAQPDFREWDARHMLRD